MSSEKPTIDKFGHQSAEEQTKFMEQYYRWQSKIYDSTRWSFLFGRRQIIQDLPLPKDSNSTVVEVGCGTGYNLAYMAKRFPNLRLIGIEVSPDMAALSRKNTSAYQDRIKVIEAPYQDNHGFFEGKVDGVLFSYSLTMINPQWKDLILQAKKDLKVGGFIAVTDFHDSKNMWFKKHMSNHHVRMDAHLTPVLTEEFTPIVHQEKAAYGGVWHYLVFIGKK